MRYFVVKRDGWLRRGRYLLPLEMPARVDRERNVLHLEAAAGDLRREDFHAGSVRPFSDEDFVAVMFATTAA